MIAPLKKPSELRRMFGENLCSLAKGYPSISELSRRLGINRTQFNRYLSGESFPRPDVLARICSFFEIDARVLLEPVDRIRAASDPVSGDFLSDFVGTGTRNLPEDIFPNGFYSFSRRGFLDADQFVRGLVFVKRDKGSTFIRGYEPREAMDAQGLTIDHQAREFRGLILQQEEGIAAFVSRRNSMTSSFNSLPRVASFENNFWVGYVTRTVRESMMGDRATRLVYEHLGSDLGRARQVAANAGYCSIGDLSAFHQRLLQPNDPFR